MADGIEAEEQPGAYAVGIERAVWELWPVLVFKIHGTNGETVPESDVQTCARRVGKEGAVGVTVGEGDSADAGQKLCVGLQTMRAKDGDPDATEVVGLGDILRGVLVKKAGFAFKAESPVRVELGVEDAACDNVMAVVCLKSGVTPADSDVAPWSGGGG